MRVVRMRSWASAMSSGGRAMAVSATASTDVPPAPNMMTGPNVLSSLTPMISSWAQRLRIMGWTLKPSRRARRSLAAHLFEHLDGGFFGLVGGGDVEAHAAHVGLVRNVVGQDLDDARLVFLRALSVPLPRMRSAICRTEAGSDAT